LSKSLRQKVLDYFRTLSEVDDINFFVFRLPGESAYFIKYGDKGVLVEAETQIYFENLAQQNDSVPCITEVYDVFKDSGRYFSVMEYVAGPDSRGCRSLGSRIPRQPLLPFVGCSASCLPRSHLKLSRLRKVVLSSTTSSRIAGRHTPSPMRRRFGHTSTTCSLCAGCFRPSYRTFLLQAISRSPKPWSSPVCFESTPRVIYHSDIKKDNFPVDANHRVRMVNFQHVGVLTLPFRQCAFYNTNNAFAAAVGRAHNCRDVRA